MVQRFGKGKGGGKGGKGGNFGPGKGGKGGKKGGAEQNQSWPGQSGAQWWPRDGKGGGSRPDKCGNCGEDGHIARMCPKPRVPFDQRKCHDCGKPGHFSSQCPRKKGRTAASVEEQAAAAFNVDEMAEEPAFFGCVGHQGEFQAARRTFKPRPHDATMADYIPVKTSNKWITLDDSEGEETDHGTNNSTSARMNCRTAKSEGEEPGRVTNNSPKTNNSGEEANHTTDEPALETIHTTKLREVQGRTKKSEGEEPGRVTNNSPKTNN